VIIQNLVLCNDHDGWRVNLIFFNYFGVLLFIRFSAMIVEINHILQFNKKNREFNGRINKPETNELIKLKKSKMMTYITLVVSNW